MPLPLFLLTPSAHFSELTQKLNEKKKNSQTAAAYHAIFHIIIIRKIFKKKKDEGKMKKVKYNKKIFLLISFNFFALLRVSLHLKGCQKQAFAADSNINDTFLLGSMAQWIRRKRD